MAIQNIGGHQLPSSSGLFAKRDFGAVGDGVTDDTTAFTNLFGAATSITGPIIYLEPGNYLIPGGITITKQGLTIIGLGQRVTGPGKSLSSSVIISNTTASTWGMTLATSSSGTNDYIGCRVENIMFAGDSDTAGGLLIQKSYCLINNCGAYNHQIGIGIKVMYDTTGGTANSAQLNVLNACFMDSCLTAIQIGESGMTGDTVTIVRDCCSLGSQAGGTGTGILVYDNSSQIFGGDIEGHDRGVYLRGVGGGRNTVIGTRFEGNATYDIDMDRASGTGSGTNNLVVVGPYTIHVGTNNVADQIVSIGATITDNGTATVVLGSSNANLQIFRSSSGSAPTGGNSGEIRIQNSRLYYNDGGTWKGLLGV